jgi:epoxyqueuosine reductase QueG
MILLGPDGADFWRVFRASPEFHDARPDPLDRWSERVTGGLGQALGAKALYPFGGPPHLPFIAWAMRSGSAWASPVGLLVHETAGLFVSYRGALALPQRIDLPATGARPCDTCDRPCLDACPAGALGAEGYDVPRCHDWLDADGGRDCMNLGCAVRRACPVGRDMRRAAQSTFHMAAFHGSQRR